MPRSARLSEKDQLQMEPDQVRISETYLSIQGEGIHAGVPTLFIRFAGCPLRCNWCDTPYALRAKDGQTRSIKEVVDIARKVTGTAHRICITGGEPLFQRAGLMQLVWELCRYGWAIDVETAGAYSLPHGSNFSLVDCWIPDIKCPSSGEEFRNVYATLGRLRHQDQVKFVIQNAEDYEFAIDVFRRYPTTATILFSPVFGAETNLNKTSSLHPQKLVEWILRDRLPVRLSLQIHKMIWGMDARSV